MCCGYSLEAPHWGASNKYPQHMFSWRNKKNIYFQMKKHLIWRYRNIYQCCIFWCYAHDYVCKLFIMRKSGMWEFYLHSQVIQSPRYGALFYNQKSSKHTTLQEHCYNVATTSRRCSDVVMMFLQCYVFAGKNWHFSYFSMKTYVVVFIRCAICCGIH